MRILNLPWISPLLKVRNINHKIELMQFPWWDSNCAHNIYLFVAKCKFSVVAKCKCDRIVLCKMQRSAEIPLLLPLLEWPLLPWLFVRYSSHTTFIYFWKQPNFPNIREDNTPSAYFMAKDPLILAKDQNENGSFQAGGEFLVDFNLHLNFLPDCQPWRSVGSRN